MTKGQLDGRGGWDIRRTQFLPLGNNFELSFEDFRRMPIKTLKDGTPKST